MDDAANGLYSRAPELEDLVGLCRSLNAAGVRYLLIGGFAVILHGAVRATKDIDLLVDASEINVRAIKRALASLPDNAAADLADTDVAEYRVVRIADEIVVDLLASACGIDYDEAIRAGIEHMTVQGVEIPVAARDVLIRTKATVRDSDRADVAFLRRIIAEDDKR